MEPRGLYVPYIQGFLMRYHHERHEYLYTCPFSKRRKYELWERMRTVLRNGSIIKKAIWKMHALKTEVKNSLGLCVMKSAFCYKNTPFGVHCYRKWRKPMYGPSPIWWIGSRARGWYKAPWPVTELTSALNGLQLWPGALISDSFRKSNWWASCRWRKKSNGLSWAVVHLKPRSVRVSLPSRENESEILNQF